MKDPDKPQQIVEAAIRVFARNGYYNSRVSDIAREAGIASGTIYLYFKTKEEILVTLFREKMAAFVAQLRREIAGEPEPVAKIRRLVGVHFSVLSAYFELIGSVLEEGVAAGAFHADLPVKVATKVLFGAMDQMATSWVLGKRGYRLVDAADAVATIFLKGVTRDGV